MSKTQSINKAKDGYVKIVVDGKEYYVDPGDVLIDNRKLSSIVKDIDDNFLEIGKKLNELIVSNNNLIDANKKLLSDNAILHARVVEFDAKLLNAVKGAISK